MCLAKGLRGTGNCSVPKEYGCCNPHSGRAFKGTEKLQHCPDCSQLHPSLQSQATSPQHSTADYTRVLFSCATLALTFTCTNHLLCARLCAKGYIYIISPNSTTSCKTGAIEIFLLQVRKLSPRGVETFPDALACPHITLCNPVSEFLLFPGVY